MALPFSLTDAVDNIIDGVTNFWSWNLKSCASALGEDERTLRAYLVAEKALRWRGVAVPQAILAHIHGDHRGQKHDTKERSDGNEAPEPRDEDFVGLGPREVALYACLTAAAIAPQFTSFSRNPFARPGAARTKPRPGSGSGPSSRSSGGYAPHLASDGSAHGDLLEPSRSAVTDYLRPTFSGIVSGVSGTPGAGQDAWNALAVADVLRRAAVLTNPDAVTAAELDEEGAGHVLWLVAGRDPALLPDAILAWWGALHAAKGCPGYHLSLAAILAACCRHTGWGAEDLARRTLPTLLSRWEGDNSDEERGDRTTSGDRRRSGDTRNGHGGGKKGGGGGGNGGGGGGSGGGGNSGNSGSNNNSGGRNTDAALVASLWDACGWTESESEVAARRCISHLTSRAKRDLSRTSASASTLPPPLSLHPTTSLPATGCPSPSPPFLDSPKPRGSAGGATSRHSSWSVSEGAIPLGRNSSHLAISECPEALVVVAAFAEVWRRRVPGSWQVMTWDVCGEDLLAVPDLPLPKSTHASLIKAITENLDPTATADALLGAATVRARKGGGEATSPGAGDDMGRCASALASAFRSLYRIPGIDGDWWARLLLSMGRGDCQASKRLLMAWSESIAPLTTPDALARAIQSFQTLTDNALGPSLPANVLIRLELCGAGDEALSGEVLVAMVAGAAEGGGVAGVAERVVGAVEGCGSVEMQSATSPSVTPHGQGRSEMRGDSGAMRSDAVGALWSYLRIKAGLVEDAVDLAAAIMADVVITLDPSPDDMEEFLAMGISCGLTEEFVAAAVRRAGLDGGDGEGD